MEKNHVYNQSITHADYLMPREPKLLLRNIFIFFSKKLLTELNEKSPFNKMSLILKLKCWPTTKNLCHY